jgi:hypothetical protein
LIFTIWFLQPFWHADSSTLIELEFLLCLQRKANILSAESFGLTQKILEINPEFYTLWNFRRDIILHMTEKGCDTINVPLFLYNPWYSDIALILISQRDHTWVSCGIRVAPDIDGIGEESQVVRCQRLRIFRFHLHYNHDEVHMSW